MAVRILLSLLVLSTLSFSACSSDGSPEATALGKLVSGLENDVVSTLDKADPETSLVVQELLEKGGDSADLSPYLFSLLNSGEKSLEANETSITVGIVETILVSEEEFSFQTRASSSETLNALVVIKAIVSAQGGLLSTPQIIKEFLVSEERYLSSTKFFFDLKTPGAYALAIFLTDSENGSFEIRAVRTELDSLDGLRSFYSGANTRTISFGSLAAETEITMADNSSKKIEEIVTGDSIRVDASGNSKQVLGTVLGVTSLPVFRVGTEFGHELLLTGHHPLFTDKGPKQTSSLRTGDMLQTDIGLSDVVSIEQVRWYSPFYNLIISADNSPDDSQSFIASGVLVGDARLQELMAEKEEKGPNATLPRLPSEWHRDYENSLDRRS